MRKSNMRLGLLLLLLDRRLATWPPATTRVALFTPSLPPSLTPSLRPSLPPVCHALVLGRWYGRVIQRWCGGQNTKRQAVKSHKQSKNWGPPAVHRCMAKVGRYRRFNESGVCRPGLGAVCTAVVGCSQGRCDAATRTCILTSNGGDCIENTECASSYCDGAVRRDDDDPDDDDDESGTCSKRNETCWDLMFTLFFLCVP